MIIKWLLPSEDEVTHLISTAVKESINNSGKAELITKYAGYSENWTKCQKYITDWLLDGKIDDDEQIQFENAIRPLVKEVLNKVRESL